MMMGRRKLFVFEKGKSELSIGRFYGPTNGRPGIKGGKIIVETSYPEGMHYDGIGAILGVSFKGYKKLCIRGNVPEYENGFDISVGFGPEGREGFFEPEEWTGKENIRSSGEFEIKMEIGNISGNCPINFYTGARSDKKKVAMEIYDIWLL